MKVDVLGTSYELHLQTIEENAKLEDIAGYCELYSKKIYVCIYPDNESDKSGKPENMKFFEQKVLRHELIHAFMYESGLHVNSHNISQWSMDEELVDWIAIQMPKIMEAYNKVSGDME